MVDVVAPKPFVHGCVNAARDTTPCREEAEQRMEQLPRAPRAAGETVRDPACGTGGVLVAAHGDVVTRNPHLTKPQETRFKEADFKGWEPVRAKAQRCAGRQRR